MKNLHKKEKSSDNASQPLLPDMDTSDRTVIDEYHKQKTFWEKTKELIVTTQEVYSGGSRDNERKGEVESLYMEERVVRVIKDSLSSKDGNRLKEAIAAIVEQEHEDRRHQCGSWKIRWKECVASSVTEQINRLPKFSQEAPGCSLSQVLVTLGKTIKSGLTHVIENLKPHYPEDFDVATTYALQYHQHLQSELSLITEYELYINDIHVLLSFTHSIYPSSILRDPVLINHINVPQLEELLPSEKVCHLEKMYILDQKIYDSGMNAAKGISDDFANKVTPILATEFLEFLQSYKISIGNHCEKNKSKLHFMDIIIANLNCCDHFRVFIERASAGEDIKQKIYMILGEIEDQGFSVLLKDLFQNMQVMAGKVHMHLVIEYLTYMKDIRQCDIDEQKALAAQMHRTADLLHHFCTDHLSDTQLSKATWANNAICKVAEILQLQDLDAIKLDVGVLANEYPDIRKRHVNSFLCIKNNLKSSERMSVVQIMEGLAGEDPLSRRLFTFIPCMPCFWPF
ncbi:tumor necrosis factor alpha-induced protein 2-like [Bufo bufo]|uniref:tumor necrosis factor alpha-induced protein 2-like n=1 Tax=Bufo bufo TaxID=8384 RepID=UPI001ABEA50C|nr:tumor necrosis factor alpha-induced protein 2-like [Bufo bufo]